MKICYYVTEDWYFCSHRLPLARAAKAAGHEVVVVTRVHQHGETITQAGFQLVDFQNRRGGANPFSELFAILRLAGIYRHECPDLVHHVAIKPVLYGSIAAMITGVPRVVNALAGLGWLYSSNARLARLLKGIIRPLLGYLLRRGKVIVQNDDDGNLVKALGVSDIRVIRGSGVDTDQFVPTGEPDGTPVVILAARLLRDKGIEEFANAGRLLVSRGVSVRFVLVGAPDPDNRSSVPIKLLENWVSKGWLEWWGRRDDMPEVLSRAHIACLPTYYGEGVPKSLIEAAACGLPIVTTDAPGCRDIVRNAHNGLLVPARDADSLADALERLILDRELRETMGRRGRMLVLNEFAEQHIVAATLRVYEEFDRAHPGSEQTVFPGE